MSRALFLSSVVFLGWLYGHVFGCLENSTIARAHKFVPIYPEHASESTSARKSQVIQRG
jgi:hypothetical protein